jgi:hypothetical protein
MTFTYTLPFNDISRVRFHLADTTSSTAMFTDEEIQAVLDETNDYKLAVIQLLENRVALLLREPDFKADWLQVTTSTAITGLQTLVAKKRQEFGLNTVTGSAKFTYRVDSGQREEPDYSDIHRAYDNAGYS